MSEIIVLKKEELESIIRDVLAEVTAKPEELPDTLTMEQAADYLSNKGLKIKKSSMYKLTMDSLIPFKRFGKRKIIFDREELDKWAESQINDRI